MGSQMASRQLRVVFWAGWEVGVGSQIASRQLRVVFWASGEVGVVSQMAPQRLRVVFWGWWKVGVFWAWDWQAGWGEAGVMGVAGWRAHPAAGRPRTNSHRRDWSSTCAAVWGEGERGFAGVYGVSGASCEPRPHVR